MYVSMYSSCMVYIFVRTFDSGDPLGKLLYLEVCGFVCFV